MLIDTYLTEIESGNYGFDRRAYANIKRLYNIVSQTKGSKDLLSFEDELNKCFKIIVSYNCLSSRNKVNKELLDDYFNVLIVKLPELYRRLLAHKQSRGLAFPVEKRRSMRKLAKFAQGEVIDDED